MLLILPVYPIMTWGSLNLDILSDVFCSLTEVQQVAQATELLYERLDVLNVTCVERFVSKGKFLIWCYGHCVSHRQSKLTMQLFEHDAGLQALHEKLTKALKM